MPIGAKLPSKQMNNSLLRSAKLNVTRRVGEQTHPPPPPPLPTLSAQRTGSPTIYFNGSQNMIAFRNAFVPRFMYTQTK